MACHVIRNFQILWILGFLGVGIRGQDPDNEFILCNTPMCKEAGEEIASGLDRSINPCDDFWAHACGGWRDRHPGVASQQDRVDQRTHLQLKSLRKDIIADDEVNKSGMRLKLANVYKSCIKFVKDPYDPEAINPMDDIMWKNGRWPITFPPNEWKIYDPDLTLQRIHENYAEISDHGALFNFNVGVIDSFTSGRKYKILMTVPRQRMTDAGAQISAASAIAVATDFARRLRGPDINVDYIVNEVAEMMEFEKSLCALKTNSVRDLSIRRLQHLWNDVVADRPEYAINWLETIRRVFDKTDITIDNDEQVVAMPKDIVDKLGDLLKKYSLRTVVNYVHWNAISLLAPYADKKSAESINGPPDKGLRSFRCLSEIKMDHGLAYVYVKKFFGNFPVERIPANEMTSGIANSMMENIHRSSWIDDETKTRFMDKIENLIRNFGYPRWYDEPGQIDDYYDELDMGSNYLENQINYNKFRKIKLVKKLRTPFNRFKLDWPLTPLKVNAKYAATQNSMSIAAVMFQMPIFHTERPWVFNYGSLGKTIGHEMGHAIDNSGQWYDKFGVRKPLSPSHLEKFDERAKCLVDQYDRYTYVEIRTNETISVNGTSTLTENIADHYGCRNTLDAEIAHMIKINPHVFDLPSVYKKNLQLFFYSVANSYCAYKPSFGHGTRHVPHSIRTNGMVSNMPEFSVAFDCPIGSPMNPENKCSILQ